MPHVEGLLAEVSTVFIEVPGDKVRVQYKKGEYTGKLMQEMFNLPNEAFLEKILIDTNLTHSVPKDPKKPDGEKEEKPYPLDKASLAKLPHGLLVAIVTAINRDQLPNRQPLDE